MANIRRVIAATMCGMLDNALLLLIVCGPATVALAVAPALAWPGRPTGKHRAT